jgi:hypothetical protein
MLVLSAAACSALPGCYSRTIEAEGLGTRWEQRDIYKPNVEKKSTQQSQPKPRRKGGLFNNIGEFFFGSKDG